MIKTKESVSHKFIPYIILTLICLGSIFAELPIINRNIDKPNLIPYFNHDEGYLMDNVWYYYTGEKTDSFQFETDYGVELLYLAGFGRLVLSKFMDVTRGTFVLLLRWLHLAFWIMALLALWRLVRYHFGTYWQPLIAVTLLAVRPSFPYLSQNSKPEPVVLFFVIVGLDYLLRIIKKPSWPNLLIAAACASLAALTKLAGFFLLPAIVIAMYLSEQYRKDEKRVFPRVKIAWLLPALVGLILIILPLVLILVYVRQSTGVTWFEEFGFWNSVLQNKAILFLYIMGILLIGLSAIFKMLLIQTKIYRLKEFMKKIETLLSHSTIVFLSAAFFLLLFGFIWVMNPGHFLRTCAIRSPVLFLSITSASDCILRDFVGYFIRNVREFDIIIFVLFTVYLLVEIMQRNNNLIKDRLISFKRLNLAFFILPAVLCMFFMKKFRHHHALPFFVASSVLAIQTLVLVHRTRVQKVLKNFVVCLIAAFLFIDVVQNVKVSANLFTYYYRWREDVVFDIVKWWRKNYPPETVVICDHPVYAYLPPEYKNAVFLNFQEDKVEQLRDLVKTFKPQLIYYNTGTSEKVKLPPIEEILPETEVELLASFDNNDNYYKRYPKSEYVIYRVID